MWLKETVANHLLYRLCLLYYQFILYPVFFPEESSSCVAQTDLKGPCTSASEMVGFYAMISLIVIS